MAATIKNVLIATGVAVDDADIDAPLSYVEEVCNQFLPVSCGPILLLLIFQGRCQLTSTACSCLLSSVLAKLQTSQQGMESLVLMSLKEVR
jgi:hypothetical protein